MVLPAVIVLLCFRDLSADHLGLSRAFALRAGAGRLHAEVRRPDEFQKLLSGSQQYHLLGTFGALGTLQWVVLVLVAAALLFLLARYFLRGRPTITGTLGRLISAAAVAFALALVAVLSTARRRRPGHRRQHAALRGGRRHRAVRARARARAALRPADPRPQLLPRSLLHPADGDAGRHRLHVPHAGRHAKRARSRRCCAAFGVERVVLGDRGLVGAPDGAARRHLAVDALHVHRAARRDREPAARPGRGGAARRRRAACRSSATSPGRRSRRWRRPSC